VDFSAPLRLVNFQVPIPTFDMQDALGVKSMTEFSKEVHFCLDSMTKIADEFKLRTRPNQDRVELIKSFATDAATKMPDTPKNVM
jgi:hypothetical protein